MSPTAEVTSIVEEYLEAVFRLQEKSGSARTNELAKMMRVAPGTVTNTVERLEKESLLTHEPYKGVRLTEKGRSIALRVLKKHRLCERLLTDVLDVEWHKAHDYACKLEHDVPDDLALKIEKALKSPQTCPHGNLIDTESRQLSRKSKPLTESDVREKVLITSVVDERSDQLKYLDTLGLRPGSLLEVVEKAPFDGPITVRTDDRTHALSRQIASIIHVRKAELQRKHAQTS